MSKKYLLHLMTILMVAMLSVGFTSCGSDDDDLEQTNIKSNVDPEGTIIVNMNNDGRDVTIGMGTYLWDGNVEGDVSADLEIDSENNFRVGGYSEIVSIGQVSGLNKVNNIPSVGWSKRTAVVPGCGYIIRYKHEFGSDKYSPRIMIRYARVYVVDYRKGTSGGIIGAVIKYQENWKNEDVE